MIYQNDRFAFELVTDTAENGASHAAIVRRRKCAEDGNGPSAEPCIKLYDYTWPEQLRVTVEETQGELEKDVLKFELHLKAHHVTGMVQGEFTETEYLEVEKPFADDCVCRVIDIVRKTRFAANERHLEHLPVQTYPALNGRQGPYGHPTIKSLPPIPKKHHEQV